MDFDRDRLARHLKTKMKGEALSVRAAAEQIGCSPATLARLLQGVRSPNYPEGKNLVRAVSWLKKTLAEFEAPAGPQHSTIHDVEAHLRGLPDLSEATAEALTAIVRAVYDEQKLEPKKSQGR